MYLRRLKNRRDSDLCSKTFIYLEIQKIIIDNIFNHCRKIIYDQRIYYMIINLRLMYAKILNNFFNKPLLYTHDFTRIDPRIAYIS